MSDLKVSTVMSSENGPITPTTNRDMMPAKDKAAGGATASDLLTAQLRQLYDSVAREPIPAGLLALLDRMKS
jgi:hypothetical protein